MSGIKLSLIVARARNGVIGRAGDLPWRLKGDLAHFKRVTKGCPVIMGRKTWESLPVRPLPGRTNIVISRDWSYGAGDARVYSNLAPALHAGVAVARRSGSEEVFIIGGEALFADALPRADRIYLTEVDAAPEGDAYFPDFDLAGWQVHELGRAEADGENDHGYRILRYERVLAA